ncbi:hypothetical protein CYMTET_48219 [Cymbomonas tetramitiformis]|uniref:DUF2723 domain-containing protein n=1 Tax=Cymbomonas tetramitiformis TaxID=36881 RepID=A0AAE0BUK9_9CHLO|nr:hypothetical protein CYMTET_48219 [Cymbomonas tetramitiformis]
MSQHDHMTEHASSVTTHASPIVSSVGTKDAGASRADMSSHAPEAAAGSPHDGALLVFAGCFLLYFSTLYPTITGGDNPEFSIVSCTGGVAHPPGYPLLSMLTKIWASVFPTLGSIAWRMNLLNAVFAAAAAALVYATVLIVCPGATASAMLAAGNFAFSPLTWQYATHIEVFALNNLLTTALLYCLVRWEVSPSSESRSLMGAFLAGLGLCNQHTLVFYTVPVVVFVLAKLGLSGGLSALRLMRLAGMFVLGVLPYGYLPYASSKRSEFSWGDQMTWQGFLVHVLRKEYGTFRLFSGKERTSTGSMLLEGLLQYGQHFLQLTWYLGPLLLIAVVGLVMGGVSVPHRGSLGVMLMSVVLYLVTFHILANIPLDQPLFMAVQKRFWLQADLILHILMGVGLAQLAHYVPRMPLMSRPPASESFAAAAGGTDGSSMARVGLSVALLSALALEGFSQQDQSANWYMWHYGRAHLEPLEPHALLVVWGDLQQFSVRYLRECEGFRRDVAVVDLALASYGWYSSNQAANIPRVVLPGVAYHPRAPNKFSLADLFDANYGQMPIYTFTPPDNDISCQGRYNFLPMGLLKRVRRASEPVRIGDWLDLHQAALPTFPLPSVHAYSPSTWEYRLLGEVLDNCYAAARFALLEGQKAGSKEGLESTVLLLEKVVELHPAASADHLFDLGYAQQELFQKSPTMDRLQHMVDSFGKFMRMASPRDDRRHQVTTVLNHYSTATGSR